ncbi:MAG: DUF5677 domain-containing protein [Terriglobia bacterium]|jgi:hypothetical protein
MDALQETLNQVVKDIPAIFLEDLISKKLKNQGITAPRALSKELARHILSGTGEPFRYNNRKYSGNINLALEEADADEIARAFDRFQNERLPKILPEIAEHLSKSVLRNLKSRWPDEYAQQEAELAGFRQRLEERWGKPLGQLRMLLTMSREWCEWAHNRNESLKRGKKKQLRAILVRLLVRGCQVTDEIICLLENGFADGAMARWRTLHEIAVVAAVLSQHGEAIAERYLDHQAVESKRALDKYLACYKDLGYEPLPAREQEKILKAYDKAIRRYGPSFGTDYGWAALHLNNPKPSFAALEKAAGRAEMRSYYQMGNDNIHAGIKSMYVRLGLLDYDGLLAGRSNGGLMEPGQNAAHTLTQLSALVCLSEPIMDDLVAGDMMRMLRDEIPKSFNRADKHLRRDDKACRSAQNGTCPSPTK